MGVTFLVKMAHPRLLWVEVTPPPETQLNSPGTAGRLSAVPGASVTIKKICLGHVPGSAASTTAGTTASTIKVTWEPGFKKISEPDDKYQFISNLI